MLRPLPYERTTPDGETVALRDGGWIRYWESFLSAPEAERLSEALRRDVPWQQFRNGLWTFPRLTAFVADVGVVYRYSGVKHVGAGWTTPLLDVRRRVEQVCGTTFNGRSGQPNTLGIAVYLLISLVAIGLVLWKVFPWSVFA